MRAASLALIALLAATVAMAQPEPVPAPSDALADDLANELAHLDITGLWRVETALYRGTCRAQGVMNIAAADPADDTAPAASEGGSPPLTATLSLAWGCRDVELGYGRQDCIVEREAAAVAISCTVVSVSPPDIDYVHDDFSLTIASPAEMTGLLLTEEPRDLPVTLTRRASALS